MIDTRPSARHRDARVFFAGAGCGFLAGALAVAVGLSQFGLLGSRPVAVAERPVEPPAAVRAPAAPVDPPVLKAPQPGLEQLPTGADQPLPGADQPDVANAPEPSKPTTAAPEDVAELAGRHLQIPVEGVSAQQLTRQFGDHRSEFRLHEALDIMAPRNTPVHAVEDGKVVRLFLSKPGGITVYQFDPAERYCYYYAHLERYADGLKEGDIVRKGQLLGYVGTSGNAPKDAPHLHFAVFRLLPDKHWWQGTPLDPYDVLR